MGGVASAGAGADEAGGYAASGKGYAALASAAALAHAGARGLRCDAGPDVQGALAADGHIALVVLLPPLTPSRRMKKRRLGTMEAAGMGAPLQGNGATMAALRLPGPCSQFR